jgi:hypothetical protein
LKLGGYVRAEMNFNANGSYNPYRNQNFDSVGKNDEVTRIRGGITVDVRSQTAYGTLRAYATMFATSTNGSAQGGSPYDPIFAPAYFIQFAGFTAGKTASFFDFDLNPYTNSTTWFGSNQGGNGIPVFAYTAQFGNGFSASISAEDTTSRRMAILDGSFTSSSGTALAPGAVTASGYAGRRWPDVVANLRIDQAWGSAQVMGAIHDVHANLGGNVDDSETGWAVGAGLRINLPMIGKGDYIMGQVTYTEGALNYTMSNSGTGGFGGFWLRDGAAAAGAAVGAYGPMFDAVQTAAGTGNLDLTKAWSVTAGFEHRWNPQWKTSLYGGYGEVNYSGAASAAIAAFAGAGGLGGVATGSADWSGWNIGTRTVWTPVANLDLSVDVMYSKINGAYTNAGTEDYDFVSGMFRVQRNFWP